MSELSKSYMGSSSLVLGFVPILFSAIGPSISEIALLSLKRLVLAVVLSLRAVSVHQSRVLQYEDDTVANILEQETVLPSAVASWLAGSRYRRMGASVLQYLLASLAVANVAWASWELGLASSLNFICQSSYMPIIWTSVPVLVFVSAAVALNTKSRRQSKFDASPLGVIKSEWHLCLSRRPIPEATVRKDASIIFWHWVSTTLGFLHTLVGILIYTSLMFAMTTDAVIIVVRYLVSVAVCRLVLIFELAGMRRTYHQREEVGNGEDVALHPIVTHER